MTVTRIATTQQWDQLQTDWRRLAGQSPCVRWEWMRTWWKHFGRHRDLYVLVVRDTVGDVIGIAPWYIESSPASGRCIGVLGSGKVCSDYVSLLAAESDVAAVAGEIADWLRGVNHGQDGGSQDTWDFLLLEGVESNAPAMLELTTQLKQRNQSVYHEESHGCWRLAIPESRVAFLESLKKNRRRKFRKIFRHYIDSGRAVLYIAEDDQEFNRLYTTLVEHHQRRWQFLGKEGCHTSPEFARFLREATEWLRRTERVILSCVEIDEVPRACSLGFVMHNVHFIYHTGMAPDGRQHQAGWALNLLHVQYAMENGFRAVDFMRGDEPYKARFGSERIDCRDYRIAADKPLARLRNSAWVAKKAMKGIVFGPLADMLPWSHGQSPLPTELSSDG